MLSCKETIDSRHSRLLEIKPLCLWLMYNCVLAIGLEMKLNRVKKRCHEILYRGLRYW